MTPLNPWTLTIETPASTNQSGLVWPVMLRHIKVHVIHLPGHNTFFRLQKRVIKLSRKNP